jgi:outer membrane protein assembly factor BamB
LVLCTAQAEEERISTFQPFETGDIFVAATVMDVPDDDHAGTGRLLQYDAELNPKGVLWVKGTTHKIGGLTFSPQGVLWGFAQLTPAVFEVAPTGVQLPLRYFSHRTLSSVTFGADGTYYFGEHLQGKETGHPAITTRFRILPGTDNVGAGNVYRFDEYGRLLQVYETQAHGGIAGFLAVTSTVLADNDTRMIYVSETGPKVMQYDLANNRQLPDLAVFENDARVPMVLTMAPFSDGRLLIATGSGVIVLDQHSGELLRHIPIEGRPGWAAVAPTYDDEFVLVGNFWTGDLLKIRIEDAEIVARTNVGQKESLSGIAQFGGVRQSPR